MSNLWVGGGGQKLYQKANLGTFIVPEAMFSQLSFISLLFLQAWSYEIDISLIYWHILLTEDSVIMYNIVYLSGIRSRDGPNRVNERANSKRVGDKNCT